MTTRYRQNPDVPATVLGGEAAVVTPSDSRLHVLNSVATRVWELCGDEGRTLDEIVSALTEEFDVATDVATNEALAFVRDGIERGILIET